MNFDPIRLEVRALPETGFLKRRQILGSREQFGILPFSESTWWLGVKSGRFPRPCYPFGPGEPLWRIEDIRTLIADLARADVAGEPIKKRKGTTNDAPQSARAETPETGGEPQPQHHNDDRQSQTTREPRAHRQGKTVPPRS
jgi:predicted DNA-binding transcriptional regulator AlpA